MQLLPSKVFGQMPVMENARLKEQLAEQREEIKT
jgi:hypothetical protein